MVRGHYISATGMLMQRRQMEVITNNVANADTTGYRREFLVSHSFDEVMARRINDNQVRGATHIVGPMHLGTQLDQLYIDFSEGHLEGTDKTTDLALIGDVFFVVQTPAGERYTRTGAFNIDNLGFLTDGEGNYLLGANGPINVGSPDFTVDDFGTVRTEDGTVVDTIRVVSFADNGAALRKQGSNLFFSLVPPQPVANQFRMVQGFIESSNVDIGRAMVDMLAIFRTYESNQRMLTMIDESVGKAVNEIGRLR